LVVTIRVGVKHTAKEDIELAFSAPLCFTLNDMTLGATDMTGNFSTFATMMECSHVIVMDWIAIEMLLEFHCLLIFRGFKEIG
jgi:hypothetical protein